jgi:RND family efflux transporter MFP subunit
MFQSALTAFRKLLRSRLGLPLGIVALAALVVAVLSATRPRLQPLPPTERVWAVGAVTVTRESVQPDLDLFGEVVAGRHSELRALVPGRVARVGPNFRDGAMVSAGELLLQIDPFDYETDLAQQRSRLREAEVRLEVVRRDLQRAQDLYAKKLVAPQFLDNARLAADQQDAVVEQQRIAVRRAERSLADARLVAPYGGVLGNVNADLGKQLSVNDRVADITDIGRLEVRFSLSNAEYGRLLASGEPVVGRPVQVTWQVGEQAIAHGGRVERLGAAVTSTTGGIDVFAVIEPAGDATPLRPGAFVRVRLADRRYDGVMRAPQSALYGADTVYIIGGEDRLESRRIVVRGYAGNDMLFESAAEPGIPDGTRVLTSQLREIGAGMKVIVR